LELQACFGFALLYTKGSVRAAHSALVRALELAESLKDAPSQLLLLCGLYRFKIRTGDFRGLDALTARCEAAAKQIEHPVEDGIANAIGASTCCFLGRYKEALMHARIALSHPVHSSQLNAGMYGGFTQSVSVRNVFSRSLWMLGYADQAIESARQGLDEATDQGPVTIPYALAWNVFVYLQTGDWLTAKKLIDRLTNYARKDDLSIINLQAVGWQGVLAILRGDPSLGIELLQTALAALRAFGYELHRCVFSARLAQGFAKAGDTKIARTTICEAVTWAEGRGRSADLPELLRIKAEILIAASPAHTSEAEGCLAGSLELARQQSALSLELRTGMSLARLWAENGRIDEALELLAPIHSRFTEGFDTLDLVAAANLLDELRTRR
jgi:tetratricopeptide (TPR) repeat protein